MDAETKTIAGLHFWLVGSLQLRRTPMGQLVEYSHVIPDGIRANAHANGPFCYFSLSHAPRSFGVYVIFVGGQLKYVGEREDLAGRFSSTGYGQISPRNLHHDGQSTNCKLNSRILVATKLGQVTEIWFHPTDERKRVESRLIVELSPDWNGRDPVSRYTHEQRERHRPSPMVRNEECGVVAEEFRTALSTLLHTRQTEGVSAVTVRAGDLHHIVGGYPGKNHRMPVCCAVMRSFMRSCDRFVYEPPKRNGARLEIEYQLPR